MKTKASSTSRSRPQNKDKDKDNMVKSLTSLSVSIESCKKKDERKVALAKFDVGLATLKATDPKNPMIKFFQDKQTEWKEKEQNKRSNIDAIVFIFVCLGVVVVAFYLSVKFFPETDPFDPVEYIKNLFNKNK